MSKNTIELATELTSQIIKSRAEIVASIDHNTTRKILGNEWLSDETVSKTYKEIKRTLDEN